MKGLDPGLSTRCTSVGGGMGCFVTVEAVERYLC